MKNKKNLIVFLSILIPVLIIAAVIAFNTGKIPPNPPGTVGNTGGNLNNNGLFCETNGEVYFVNTYDSGSLYRMNVDESHIKKVSDAQVKYINAVDKYLYYFQDNTAPSSSLGFIIRVSGMYRMKKSTGKTDGLDTSVIGIMTLVDNSIYYQRFVDDSGMHLYKLNIGESEPIEIAQSTINPASCHDGFLYYNGVENNHFLSALNTADGSISTILEGNIWNPVAMGDYIFYMDVSNNYQLCRYSLSTGENIVLTTDRIDLFNPYGEYVYYQKNSTTEPALKRIRIDGTEEEIIQEGNFSNINITSEYVYFNAFGAPTPIYKTPTYGSVSVTTFDAAQEAAFKEIMKK